jgi:hypothetical protein
VRFFLWAKGLSANDVHKEIFPVYGGPRDFHLDDRRFAEEDDEREMRKWLRQQSRDFCTAGKAVAEDIARNIVFQFRMSHVLRFISVCDLFADSVVPNLYVACCKLCI